MRKTFLIILFYLVSALVCLAQVKYEKESRLKTDKVPKVALNYVESLKPFKKLKWYNEESLTGNSIEAKFEKDKLEFSVEFDSLGYLEDIEIIRPWEEISNEVQEKITAYLESQFAEHEIRKIQFQFTGSPNDLATLAKGNFNVPETSYTLKYELVVKGKIERNINLYEILFDDKGLYLNLSKILLRNTDNLEY